MFDNVKRNFGFGCMRLPMIDGEVDIAECNRMVDAFIANGFNYFDTAHGYLGGKSELALKNCLVNRYKREDYVIADKLSSWMFEKEEDIRPLFEKQLKAVGVDYFDIYLLHAQNRNSYKKCRDNNAYKIIEELKKEGKIKCYGISFHDTAEVLDTILEGNP